MALSRGPVFLSSTDRHFQRALYCMVLMKTLHMSLIQSTPLAINRICFSKNRKWKWRAWWKAYRIKLIDTCYASKYVFIHGVQMWFLGMSMMTSWNKKYVCGVHRLNDTHRHTHTQTLSLLTFFAYYQE